MCIALQVYTFAMSDRLGNTGIDSMRSSKLEFLSDLSHHTYIYIHIYIHIYIPIEPPVG